MFQHLAVFITLETDSHMLSRELKIGIIGGVGSSILVIIFIQPILSLVWSAVLSVGEAVQAGYVDRIYRNAALGERNLVGHLSLLTLTMLLVFIPVAFLSAEMARRHESIRRVTPAFHTFMFLTSLVATIVLLIAFSLSSGVTEINASFIQRLTVLSPAISDQEYKEWRARWAKMRGKNDYRGLVAAMDQRALELKVELPELRKP